MSILRLFKRVKLPSRCNLMFYTPLQNAYNYDKLFPFVRYLHKIVAQSIT
jgi:hypothetical protein